MRRLVDVLISDRLVLSVIVLNTVALFLFESAPHGSGAWRFWHTVDYACVVFFLVEAVLKIRRFSWSGYWSSGWNRFDIVVVVLSLPMMLTPLVGGFELFANFLVLRLGRLFRLFRVLRFIPNLDHLVTGIRRALRASVGVFLALFLINFILAMGATLLFREVDPEHFGNPLRSGYSLFKVFTVEGWYEIPDHIASELAAADGRAAAVVGGDPYRRTAVEWGVRLYFIASVLVGGILGLSLANAVFVDEMMMDNTRALESKVDALTDELRRLREDLKAGDG